ncbi:G-type lectin S-receptor-like serine/threonine-protein kinase At4g27290 [Magnolia sinica]|uniref:G-type lectin S-receptor-like serine/threonine-protein kinase At4g27290 n=1 Tax=Magnolia sinica TaxID=86752 RepID=UPI00265A4FC2|nr:G-type lectin S-receptor-like serine/threonine-protein kinase At4g27290 [Magnolia sinica]
MAFQISFPKSLLILSLLFPISTSIDTITPSQSIKDGETLISAAGNYELGFFSPGNSTSWYIGIWYKKAPPEKKYIWVANRDDPLTNSSGVLSIATDGNLAVSIMGQPAFPITNASTAVNYTTAKLLDTGNLVLQDNQNRVLWQSFDYPTDTMVPGMKFGFDRRTGRSRIITSWKSENDPSSGDYVLRLDPHGSPQLYLQKGSDVVWRSGPWIGQGYSGVPLMFHQSVVTYHFTNDDDGIYYWYDLNNNSIFSRAFLDSSGDLQRLVWQAGAQRWTMFWRANEDKCDQYSRCGTYSSCDVNRVLICECLQGFKPKVPEAWNLHDWSGGCDRRQGLGCGKGDGFKKVENVKLPDTSDARVVRVSGLRECRDECLKNCSCSGYSSAEFEKWGGECLIWYGDLTDVKLFTDGGMDLYVRLAGSEFDSSSKRKRLVLILALTVIPGTLLISLCSYRFWKRKTERKGFFSPGNSTSWYIGIWYKKAPPEKKYIWVANRDNPLTNSSGVLSIATDGNLAVSIMGQPAFPITNASTAVNYTTAKLLDTGNLVLQDNQNRVLWQSFDYPTDTMVPGMKFGFDRRTGRSRIITSWKSENDPSSGDYVLRLDPHGSPQLYLQKGSDVVWRSGPWIGQGYSGVPLMFHQSVVTYHFTNDDDGIYYWYDLNNNSIFSRAFLDSSGDLQRLVWQAGAQRWTMFWRANEDKCDQYSRCGTYSSCDVNRVLICECLEGFKPKVPEAWNLHDWSGGCDRRQGLGCGKGDGFKKVENVKLPDTSVARVVRVSGLRECRDECLKNCSCSGYSSAEFEKWGGECLIWYGDLTDVKLFTDGGMDLYVRLAGSEFDSSSKRKKLVLIVALTVIPGTLLIFLCSYRFWKGKTERKGNEGVPHVTERRNGSFSNESVKTSDLPLFNLDDVVIATDDFSESNKLGEGGFGPVYKGTLRNGIQIAVKRLSRNSGQGIEEFKNEVALIQQLQHRNLVRILGCCIQGEEKMLIYEYMQNKSLNYFIFDQGKGVLLDWRKRFDIIVGIARGVLYLHHDSRLRIIHRDLKASNILLDDEMNPKISDFGMARIFKGNQTQGNTNRVVGTYGYMSPEYAIDGLFSVKSDVFSFGVLLLEIISGKRNNGYHNPDSNLMGHAWHLWNEGRSLDLVDSSIADSCPTNEVLRCIHVGLLCVQENVTSRPTMLSVVSMLCNEMAIPPPKKPAYCNKKNFMDADSSTSGAGSYSINEMTTTEVQAR